MPKYVVLVNWTEKGVAEATDTLQRAEKVRQAAARLGGKEDLLLWTLGRYDLVGVFDMPDDESITALALGAARMGTVRTETLRAFTDGELEGVFSKMG